jgi:hypothetical protein
MRWLPTSLRTCATATFAPPKHPTAERISSAGATGTRGCRDIDAQSGFGFGSELICREGRFWRIVLKESFWGNERKFFEPLMRFALGDMRGPHRFNQKRPRSFVSALRSIALAESAKNQLLRGFRRRSIFDFCNTIDAKQTFSKPPTSPKCQKQSLALSRQSRALTSIQPCRLWDSRLPHDHGR